MKTFAHFACWISLLALLVPSAAEASWAGLPLRELVTGSDDVVTGTLENVRSSLHGGYELSEGDLAVERCLCGDRESGEKLVLRWMTLIDSKTGLKSSGALELEKYEGQSRLWLLAQEPDGSVHADHPRRVMPVEEAGTVLDTLAVYPYRVIAPDRDADEPAMVAILFRNLTGANLTVPGIHTGGTHVAHGDGFAFFIEYYQTSRGKVEKMSTGSGGALQYDRTISPVTLAPGESSRVEIPLSGFFDEFLSGTYNFAIHVNGRRTDHRFVVRTVWGSRLNRVRHTPAEAAFYVQTLRDRAPESREAVTGLRFSENAIAVAPDLMRMCDSLETDIRCQVISLIAQMDLDAETRLEFLLDRIDDPERAVSKTAWAGVCRILGDQNVLYRRDEVIDRLLTQLDDANPQVRRNAANSLASIKAGYAVPRLQQMASDDTDAQVRGDATRAVETIQGRSPCCRCDEPVP